MDFDEPIESALPNELSSARDAGSDVLNPYHAPILTAEIVEDPNETKLHRKSRPRAWTSFLVVGVSGLSFLLASVMMTFVAIYVIHGSIDLKTLGSEGMLISVMGSRLGLLITLVLPQLALVIPAIIAAFLSPVETRRRLGLVRGDWPIWTWIAAALATPLIGMVSALVVGMFMQESESLQELTSIFQAHGESGFLIPLALIVGLTPAFCEELLFRGYLQTRLVKSFGPLGGILTASFLFALLHMDFVHVLAVFPLGLFLGWVTWRSGSLFPAMMGHFFNNAISVVLAVHASEENPEMIPAPAIALIAGVLALGAAGLAATCYASATYRKTESTQFE